MAPPMYPNPINEQSLLEAAQRGKGDAIARLLQNALTSEGVKVTAEVNQSQLDLLLTGGVQSGPDAYPEWIISFIQQSLRQLQPQHIATVQITWPSAENDQGNDQGNDQTKVSGISLAPSPLLPASQIEAWSDDDLQVVATQLGQSPTTASSSVPQVAIGSYLSQFTSNGVLVTAQPQPSESPWQKRRQVDSAYRCSPIIRLLNRQTELKAAIATLQAGGAMSFSGDAGSGKTALLRTLCHHPQLLPRFPGGIIYQRAYRRPLEDLMQNVFDALYQHRSDQLSPKQQADQQTDTGRTLGSQTRKPTAIEQYQHLSQHQLCLVLDEMETSGESLQSLAQWPNLSLLIASAPSHPHPSTNHPSTNHPSANHTTISNTPAKPWESGIPNSRHLPLKGLPIKDAVVLLEEGLGRSLQPAEEKAAQKLCAYLGGHPRRLIQIAALIRQGQANLSELVKQLHQGTLPEAIILKVVSSLPESDRRVIAILAAFAGTPVHGIHLPTLADLDSVTDQLTALVDQGLVWTDGTFYRLADNLLDPLQQHWRLTPWVDQAMTYFQSWLEQLTHPTQSTQPSGYPNNGLSTVRPILENSDTLWYLIGHAVRYQQWSDVLTIGRLLEPGFWLGQQWSRWRQVLLLQWQAARSLQDKAAEALILHQLGSRALCLEDGITAHACLAQAFDARVELGDLDGATISRHNLNVLARSFFALETVVTTQTNPETPQNSRRSVTLTSSSGNQSDTGRAELGESSFVPPHPPSPSSPAPDTNTAASPDEPLTPPSESATSTPSTEEPEEAVLLAPSGFAWIWWLLGGGVLAFIGLLAFFLGQEPKTDISKLRSKHTFPPQRIGVISEPHKFTITNTTASPIVISVDFEKGDRQEFAINSNDCVSQPLAPAEICAIAATFEPQEKGPRSVSFMVQVGQNTAPKRLTLQGVGAAVKADLNPLEITFAPQRISERSEPQTITLKNKGTVAFMVQGSNLINNEQNAFFIERDTCFGQILQPRDDCSLAVSFVPLNSTEYQTTLEIVDDTEQEIWRVRLTGEGIQPSPPAPTPRNIRPNQRSNPQPNQPPNENSRPESPSRNGTTTPEQPSSSSSQAHQFTVRPEAIAFDQQELNSTDSRILRLQNTGTMPLELETITLGGLPFALQEESCRGRQIEPGNECVVAIAFTPTQPQTYVTKLTITSAQAGTQTINISGTGIPQVSPSPPDAPIQSPEESELAPPSINTFSATPSTTVEPNDVVELCYNLSNTDSAYILNQTTKEQTPISTESPSCISQTVAATTTYTLVAVQTTYEPVERSVTLTVIDDRDPPPTPVAIAPTGSHPIYCNSPVILEWQSVTDTGGPVSYGINLQRQDVSISDTGTVESSSSWTPLFSRTLNQTSLNISSTAQAPHVYRWQVQAIDTAGNTSAPTGWNEFLCINP